jgi:hypothetical protein
MTPIFHVNDAQEVTIGDEIDLAILPDLFARARLLLRWLTPTPEQADLRAMSSAESLALVEQIAATIRQAAEFQYSSAAAVKH